MASRFYALGVCLAAALAITALFAAVALGMGVYTSIDLAIGSVWFFSITFMASMPLIIPRIQRRGRKASA